MPLDAVDGLSPGCASFVAGSCLVAPHSRESESFTHPGTLSSPACLLKAERIMTIKLQYDMKLEMPQMYCIGTGGGLVRSSSRESSIV